MLNEDIQEIGEEEIDEESFNNLLYSLIDMAREVLSLTDEEKAKLDIMQAELIDDE